MVLFVLQLSRLINYVIRIVYTSTVYCEHFEEFSIFMHFKKFYFILEKIQFVILMI